MDTDNILRKVRVAKPCRASWEKMSGDDRVRHCTDCRLNVYNFLNMTGIEISNLLKLSEGRVCGRFYQRPDGTMITSDCPLGEAPARVSKIPLLAAAVMLFAMIGAAATRVKKPEESTAFPVYNASIEQARDWPLVGKLVDMVFPRPQVVMGVIACPPPPSVPSKSP